MPAGHLLGIVLAASAYHPGFASLHDEAPPRSVPKNVILLISTLAELVKLGSYCS